METDRESTGSAASRRNRRNARIESTYEDLANTGVITEDFQHGKLERELFAKVMAIEIRRLASDGNPAILEAGCGAGAWIETLHGLALERLVTARWYGFDLTPGMVRLAEQRLAIMSDSVSFSVGDVLDDDAYLHHPGGNYDLLYAYDVVQQLARTDQMEAVETLLRHVAPGGTLVVFDHDADSLYGVLMAVAKRLTRLGLPVLPAYYLTARYPKLARIRASLAGRPGVDATIVYAADRRKRALVVRVFAGEADPV
jgi:SAM-dependent methyltransferase